MKIRPAGSVIVSYIQMNEWRDGLSRASQGAKHINHPMWRRMGTWYLKSWKRVAVWRIMDVRTVNIHVSFITTSVVFTPVVIPLKAQAIMNPFCYRVLLQAVNINSSHTGRVDLSLFPLFSSFISFLFPDLNLVMEFWSLSELTEEGTVWHATLLLLLMDLLLSSLKWTSAARNSHHKTDSTIRCYIFYLLF
jgi:hypothetical protein